MREAGEGANGEGANGGGPSERRSLREIVRRVNDLLATRNLSGLNDMLAIAACEEDQPIKLMALLRSSSTNRQRLPAWGALLDRARERAECSGMDGDVLRGLRHD